MPNVIMFAGPGATVSYEPDPEETALLGYGRNRIKAPLKKLPKLMVLPVKKSEVVGGLSNPPICSPHNGS